MGEGGGAWLARDDLLEGGAAEPEKAPVVAAQDEDVPLVLGGFLDEADRAEELERRVEAARGAVELAVVQADALELVLRQLGVVQDELERRGGVARVFRREQAQRVARATAERMSDAAGREPPSAWYRMAPYWPSTLVATGKVTDTASPANLTTSPQ